MNAVKLHKHCSFMHSFLYLKIFVLQVYSTKRKASLSTLGAFSMNIPELPIQFVAVTENMSQGVYTNSTDINSLLLAEGSNLADKLNAHFMTSMSAIPQKCKNMAAAHYYKKSQLICLQKKVC